MRTPPLTPDPWPRQSETEEDAPAVADDLAVLERRIVEDAKRHVADSELRLRIMARSRA